MPVKRGMVEYILWHSYSIPLSNWWNEWIRAIVGGFTTYWVRNARYRKGYIIVHFLFLKKQRLKSQFTYIPVYVYVHICYSIVSMKEIYGRIHTRFLNPSPNVTHVVCVDICVGRGGAKQQTKQQTLHLESVYIITCVLYWIWVR